MPRNRGRWRIINHLLENHVHEEEQRLRFHDENDTFLIGVIIEVLVDTSIFDKKKVILYLLEILIK